MANSSKTFKLGKIHHGDCLELMQRIEAGSIDLVFADPPFNIGYEYDQYDDRQDDQKYLDWCRKWIAEVHRILKPTGTFWLAIGDEYAAELKMLAQRDIGFFTRSWVIWYYTFGVNCVRGFSRSHTHLLHFVKDPTAFTFNSENPLVRVKSARQLVYADSRANPIGRLPDNTWFLRPQDVPGGFTPSHDTWYFSRVAGTFKEREGFHGCQMPEQLLGRIIRLSSKPRDIVFDPFGGSGTTLVVAKKLGRRWLGTEMSADYVRRIEGRLANANVGDPLDGPADPVRSAPATSSGRKKGQMRNGELLPQGDPDILQGIVEAYKSTCQGWSTDYLLCNAELDQLFVEQCKKSGLAGNAFAWNRLLLRVRKQGCLPRATRKSPRMTFKDMDRYSCASEIAMRVMELEYNLTLDNVLCWPEIAVEFDHVAQQFAPNETSFNLRWAALAIRKRASTARTLAKNQFAAWVSKSLPPAKNLEHFSADKYQTPGVYIVESERQELYVGESLDVRLRVRDILDSATWQEWNPTSLRVIQADANLCGLQAALVKRENPLFNTKQLIEEQGKQSF